MVRLGGEGSETAVGGLFEAVDPGVVAAGVSVGERFFEADLLLTGGFFEELAVGARGPGTKSDRSQSPIWVWATSLPRWVAGKTVSISTRRALRAVLLLP